MAYSKHSHLNIFNKLNNVKTIVNVLIIRIQTLTDYNVLKWKKCTPLI